MTSSLKVFLFFIAMGLTGYPAISYFAFGNGDIATSIIYYLPLILVLTAGPIFLFHADDKEMAARPSLDPEIILLRNKKRNRILLVMVLITPVIFLTALWSLLSF